MVQQTKAQRSASALKAARTRKLNAKLKAGVATKTAAPRKRQTAAKKRPASTTAKKPSAKRTVKRIAVKKTTTKSKGKRR